MWDSAVQVRNEEESANATEQTTELAAEAASPVNPDDADKGALDGSQAAGAGEAAGEGSPGDSKAADGRACGESDHNVSARSRRQDDGEAEFARLHSLPLKGILENRGRLSLSREHMTIRTSWIFGRCAARIARMPAKIEGHRLTLHRKPSSIDWQCFVVWG